MPLNVFNNIPASFVGKKHFLGCAIRDALGRERGGAPCRGESVFAIRISGLFSACSQLLEDKNRESFPLFSAGCQVWEIAGERAEWRWRIAGYWGIGKRSPSHPHRSNSSLRR
jgi:hypothetical protein